MSARVPNPHPDNVESLVDVFLADQRRLTAVDRFNQLHTDARSPLLESHYRDLIPLSAPRPGEQYAFEVDLDRCSSCKACVSACHSLNGLDDDETWRDVSSLIGLQPPPSDRFKSLPHIALQPAQPLALALTVTSACHHCADPACLNGCPVLAYDKDPVSGIVRHLDDQCIGCSYCILKCPYEVPRYSSQRGIVRKCDLCHGRLAEGEAPACVQACPSEAIRITLVSIHRLQQQYRDPAAHPSDPSATCALPGLPDPAITVPTTRYHSTRPLAQLQPVDFSPPQPAPSHLPLVWMLTLTQWGGGLLLASAAFSLFQSASAERALPIALTGTVLFQAGLIASAFHLGQPLKAWRVWLGWRRSWLSREAILLGADAGITVLWLGAWAATRFNLPLPTALLPTATLAVLFAIPIGTGAQAMVYIDTQRPFWRAAQTMPRFFGSLAQATLWAALLLQPSAIPTLGILVVTALGILSELRLLKRRTPQPDPALARTVSLFNGPLAPAFHLRLALAFIACLIACATPAFGWFAAWPGFIFAFTASWIERRLFFNGLGSIRSGGSRGASEPDFKTEES